MKGSAWKQRSSSQPSKRQYRTQFWPPNELSGWLPDHSCGNRALLPSDHTNTPSVAMSFSPIQAERTSFKLISPSPGPFCSLSCFKTSYSCLSQMLARSPPRPTQNSWAWSHERACCKPKYKKALSANVGLRTETAQSLGHEESCSPSSHMPFPHSCGLSVEVHIHHFTVGYCCILALAQENSERKFMCKWKFSVKLANGDYKRPTSGNAATGSIFEENAKKGDFVLFWKSWFLPKVFDMTPDHLFAKLCLRLCMALSAWTAMDMLHCYICLGSTCQRAKVRELLTIAKALGSISSAKVIQNTRIKQA